MPRVMGAGYRVDTRYMRLLSSYGLLVLLVALIIAFSIAKPNSFPTIENIRSIMSSKSIVALAGLSVTLPLAAGQFDLSVGYVLGLSSVLSVGFQTNQHLPWPVAIVAVLAVGAGIGLLNGILVTRFHVNSFIATLGVGTVLSGIVNWYTQGAEILGNLPSGFTKLASNYLGIPAPTIYLLVVCVVLWLFLEYRPGGRRLYVIGAAVRTAELNGIAVSRYITGSFVAAGVVSASAGVILGATLQLGEPTVGPEYLLPAFAGALLGSTTIRPGRVNVWGTIFAVMTLAVAVSGLELLGVQFYVEDIFNGTILVIAVALAVYGERHRRNRTPAELTREIIAPTLGSAADPISKVVSDEEANRGIQ